MTTELERRIAHDGIVTSSLVRAAGTLYDDLLNRVLTTPDRVTSAAEGKRLLAQDDDAEELTDRMQRLVMLAVPVVRTLARGARFTRIPWVLVGSTVASTTMTIRAGVREVRVLASLVAYRLEQTTGAPADPALVKKLTLELYLHPRRQPDVSDRSLPLARLVRRWLFRGALGRDTTKVAGRALDAAERLDLTRVLGRDVPS